jgi:Flp pilus assembly pilin Flp
MGRIHPLGMVLKHTWRAEEGQALVEYALILFMIALVVFAILGTMGGTVSSLLSVVSSEFP